MRLPSLCLLLLALAPLCPAPRAAAQPDLIFQPGSTSFPSSHASTIVQTHDGTLLAAWFGGTAEGAKDVAIWAARQTPQGWSAPVELVREPGEPCWNPVLFHTNDGTLWLYYKFGPTPATWTAARRFSNDEGVTWSPIERIPAGLTGPVRAKPLVLPDGTIVSGASTESYHSWAVWIERSTDRGTTWKRIGPFVPPLQPQAPDPAAKAPTQVPGSTDWKQTEGIIQPSVVALSPTHLRFYARSTARTARVVIADSLDAGITWSPARPIDVLNPNSGIDAVALRDGRVVLIYNDTTSGRSPLNLAVSADGEHFTMFKTLESQPGEFSYPALIQSAAGDLEMTYTWNRKSIRYIHLPLAEIPKPGQQKESR